MDKSTHEVIFAKTLVAATVATAGGYATAQVVTAQAEDVERLAKIESLRRQIASGDYLADVSELSKRMVDDHLAS